MSGAVVAAAMAAGAVALAAGPSEPAVRVDPGAIELRAGDRPVQIELHNDGGVDVAIDRVRVEGRDWVGFVVVTPTTPPSVPAGGVTSIALDADDAHFARGAGAGRATLHVTGPRLDVRVPLRFRTKRAGDGILSAVVGLAGTLTVVLGTARGHRHAPILLGGMLALGVLPLAPAICPDAIGRVLGSQELAACAQGRGGGPLRGIPLPLDLVLWATGMWLIAHAAQRSLAGQLWPLLGATVAAGIVCFAGVSDLAALALPGAITGERIISVRAGAVGLVAVGALARAPDALAVERTAWAGLVVAALGVAGPIFALVASFEVAHGLALAVQVSAFAATAVGADATIGWLSTRARTTLRPLGALAVVVAVVAGLSGS